MQLHELNAPRAKYPKRRPGRGGKRGTTAGHGTKGQKSRSGHRIRPAVRDLIQRIPKLRGFKNRSQEEKPIPVTLDRLNAFPAGTVIEPKTLVGEGRSAKRRGVKVLNEGAITKAVTLKDIAVSKEARKKIEAAGGKIQ